MIIQILKKTSRIYVNEQLVQGDSVYCEGLFLNGDFKPNSFNELATDFRCFQRKYKGRYLVVGIDSKSKEVLIINDWLSKMPVYYFDNDSFFIASCSFFCLLEECGKMDIHLTPSLEGLYFSINDCGMVGDVTQFSEIKCLRRYESIRIIDGKVHIATCNPQSSTERITKKNALNRLDSLFAKALALQLSYNEEKGFIQPFSISAGMDSRMVLLSAYKKNKVNWCFSYSQKNSIDDIISRRICGDKKIDLLSKDLSEGECLRQFDVGLKNNEGQQLYCGSTGALLLSEELREKIADRKTIIHCGLLGGELLAYEKTDDLPQYSEIDGFPVFSSLVKTLNENKDYRSVFLEKNTRLCQNLAFQLHNAGICISPFMDEDFYDFALQLDKHWLKRRKIYKQWMRRSAPNKYVTTYDCSSIYAPSPIVFANKLINWLKRKKSGFTKFDMCPFDAWMKLEKNTTYISQLFYRLFDSTKEYLPIEKQDFSDLFERSPNKVKFSLLTYLGVLDYYAKLSPLH